jgi:DNA-binding NarL/FixJ family response regulator
MTAAANTQKLIFIVEDNAVYAKSLEFYLKSRFDGLDIRIFPVGELCMDNLHLNPYLIIMDYELNSRFFDAENGLAILQEIKQKDKKRPIVVLSGQDDPKVAEDVRGTGCYYVDKNDIEAFKKIENHISLMAINHLDY